MTFERGPLKGRRGVQAVPAIIGQAETVQTILQNLAGEELSADNGLSDLDVARTLPPEREHAILAARRLIKLRHLRRSYLPTKELGEPAWDLLLMIYVSEPHVSRGLKQTEVARVAEVPQTTTLRTLRRLEIDGLVQASTDPLDRRASLYRLTDNCRRALDRYFEIVVIAFAEELI